MKRKLQVTVVLVILVILTGAGAYQSNEARKDLVFAESLEEVAVVVDGVELYLSDMAVYIAYQEKEVQEEALIYDSKNPSRYWNAHTNGYFIRSVAEEAVVNMAVHDEIFYQKACAKGLDLDEQEKLYLENEIYDFCTDLTEEQLAKLGVDKEKLESAMYKIALANKYQFLLTQTEGVDYTAYDYTEPAYEELLAEHTVEVNENIWDRISVGNITVNYK